jgi:hypothetical protein
MSDLLPFLNPNPPEPAKITELYCSHLARPERVLYRYEIYVRNYDNEGVTTRVYRNIYPVIGETPASWIYDDHGQRRHVLKGDGKRAAHETEEMAASSLRKRTRWRQSHAHWALTQAHAAIDAYNELFGGEKPIEKAGSL